MMVLSTFQTLSEAEWVAEALIEVVGEEEALTGVAGVEEALTGVAGVEEAATILRGAVNVQHSTAANQMNQGKYWRTGSLRRLSKTLQKHRSWTVAKNKKYLIW